MEYRDEVSWEDEDEDEDDDGMGTIASTESLDTHGSTATHQSGGSGGKAGLYDEYDYIFAFGDLNYRIEQVPYAEVVDMTEGAMKESAMKGTDMPSAKTNCIKFLLENDQLHATMRRGVPDLTEFGEAPINFFPTYKFDRKNPMIYDRTTYIRLWQRHDGVMQN